MIVNRELQRIPKVLRYPDAATKFTVSFKAVQLGVKVVVPMTAMGERARIVIEILRSIMLDEAVMIDIRITYFRRPKWPDQGR
jgi:hypothetical protein